jgi:hypothetical protein
MSVVEVVGAKQEDLVLDGDLCNRVIYHHSHVRLISRLLRTRSSGCNCQRKSSSYQKKTSLEVYKIPDTSLPSRAV